MKAPSATAARYQRRRMVTAEVWREVTTTDAGGGQTVAWTQVGETDVELLQASADERRAALQAGNDITHNAVLPLDTIARRTDRLVIGDTATTLTTDPVTNSTDPVVSRAPARADAWAPPIGGD